MRKLSSLVFAFAIAFLMVGVAHATVEIDSGDNAVIVGAHMGGVGVTPVTEVIKVSTGSGTSASVGNAMTWDTTWGDGYHVAVATTSSSSSTPGAFAGVMVTTTSQDSNYGSTTAKANSPTVGYMAIRGLVRAYIGTGCTAGYKLALYGATTNGSLKGIDPASVNARQLSQDIGVILKAEGSISRVWLK